MPGAVNRLTKGAFLHCVLAMPAAGKHSTVRHVSLLSVSTYSFSPRESWVTLSSKSLLSIVRTKRALPHLEITFQVRRRIWTNPDLERPLLHYVAQVWSDKAELLHRDFKPYGLDFSRLQGNALETLQLFDGPGNGAYQVAHVELHY